MTNLRDPTALVAFMRQHGVCRIDLDGDQVTSIELFPPTVPVEAPPEAPEVTETDDLCNCGHDAPSHMDGLCIEGCESTVCQKRR